MHALPLYDFFINTLHLWHFACRQYGDIANVIVKKNMITLCMVNNYNLFNGQLRCVCIEVDVKGLNLIMLFEKNIMLPTLRLTDQNIRKKRKKITQIYPF